MSAHPARRIGAVLASAAAVVAAQVVGVAGALAVPNPACPLRTTQTAKSDHGIPPWPQKLLDFDAVWTVTRGYGQKVAVVDTGFTAGSPQMRRVHVADGVNVTRDEPRDYTADCAGHDPKEQSGGADERGHGTQVASIIAAAPLTGIGFHGVAPEVTLIPVKAVADDTSIPFIAAGINAAVEAGAKIINVSATQDASTSDLQAAIANAARHDAVVIAAAGNVDSGAKPRVFYPAAYAGANGSCTNVISVGAINRTATLSTFSATMSNTTVVAPGEALEAVGPSGGFADPVQGTSYAAPFVTGTVALIRAAQPKLTATQVCRLLERTASAGPKGSGWDPGYGFGTVNPTLAVTTPYVQTQSTLAAQSSVPYPVAPHAADRSAQHRSLVVSVVLLGLAAFTVFVGSFVRRWRRPARGHR